jgi:dienelactone hydrolase
MSMKRHYLTLLFALFALGTVSPAWTEVKTKTIDYRDGDTELQGYLAWDDAVQGKRPGIIVVHEWWGLDDYAKKRVQQLAKLGYVAFAADMYGKGQVTDHPDKAGEWSKQITSNVDAWQKRALAGLEVLRKQEQVDPQRLAAIGYCFGGATAMQMAYAGADLDGVVSFHGSLPVPEEGQGGNIKAKVLAFHGSEDGFVPREKVTAFQEAMDKAKADWHMVVFGGAKHGFTVPGVDKHGIENLRYDKEADERSWKHMQLFFDEIFGTNRGKSGAAS